MENLKGIHNDNDSQLTLKYTMANFFETIETEQINTETTSPPNMVEPSVNRNFENNFHHQNGPKQNYHTQKQAGCQHQPRHYHQSRNFSPKYLKCKS